MKNPLLKRLPRELKDDFPKYFVIFMLLVLMIGLISGFLVADESMIKAYNESFEKYNIEDGHFVTRYELNRAQWKSLNQKGITLYKNYYTQDTLHNDSVMRLYIVRDEINLACLMDGKLPEKSGEIAIDRMYASNNDLKIGDTLESDNYSYKIVGLVALSDYSALFENNSDTMFDSIKFGVGVIPESDFSCYKNIVYDYSWLYDEVPSDEQERSDELLKQLNQEVVLEEYIPQYLNQSIHFTGDDMGSDKAMMQLLLYIMMAIIAFVFAVTISNTIIQEANVIGTLRASGYTKSELIRHYMVLPIMVTLIAALIGNILGYTFFKNMMANLYYESYSLPTYITIWSPSAFIETSLIPIILMIVINYGMLRYKLSLSPLQFLRRDLKKTRNRKTIKLSPKLSFFTRFRLRIILQNIGNYIVLFFGILFANILLLFGLGLPNLLDNYSAKIQDNMLANYQYILTIPASMQDDTHHLKNTIEMLKFSKAVETKNETAEKFTVVTLQTLGDKGKVEDIMIYGVDENSEYVNVPKGEVLASIAMHQKYGYGKGDDLILKEEYEEKEYTFSITGTYDYSGGVCLFMNREDVNKLFDYKNEFFCGYFSQTPITDIDEKYLGTTIDINALTKISRQLDHSMGSMAYLVCVVAVIMFMILMYLLSKTIIEKNAQSISLTKILGYENKEVSQLYIMATSIVTVILLLISVPLDYMILVPLFTIMMRLEMTGWIMLDISTHIFILTFVLGVLAYIVIGLIEYRKIQKVPMDEALKNIE